MSPEEAPEYLRGGDPTKSSRIERPDESQLPVGHSLNSRNERRAILAGSEGLFYKIKNVPEMQQFISRILKPFLNVADIVKTESGWYSYKPPMENIERKEYAAQHYGDAILIALLTGDRDRLGAGNSIYEAGSSLQFDFEGAYYFWTDWSVEAFAEIRKWLETQSNAELSLHFSDKLEKMRKYYESVDGHDQMEAAFKASGKQMSELFKAPTEGSQPTFEDFYKEFVRRVAILDDTAKGSSKKVMNEKIGSDKGKTPYKFDPHAASIHPAPLAAPHKSGEKRGRDVHGHEYQMDLTDTAERVYDIYGRKFRILRDFRFPKGQQLCARILKGIIPVSDVVRFEEGKHFFRDGAQTLHGSYIVPIENNAPISDVEDRANRLLLSYIFKDTDKDQNRSKVAYFDFEYMPIFFMNPNVRSISGEFKLRARQVNLTAPNGVITQEVLREDETYYGKSTEVRHALYEKLLALQSRFSGKEGEKYLRTIVNSIGAPLHEIMSFPPSVLARRYLSSDGDNYLFGRFYKTLTRRITDSLKAVQEYDASQAGK